MRTKRLIHVTVYLVTLTAFLLWGGCSLDNLAIGGQGSGSETTNGFVAVVRYQDGTTAAYASVKVRPSSFLRDTAAVPVNVSSSSMIDTTTDSAGRILLESIDAGEYAIEVLDAGETSGALLRGGILEDSVIDYGVVFLDPLGSFSGAINCTQVPPAAAVHVQVYGLDVAQRVDAAAGNFTVSGIPAGKYSILISTTQPSFVSCIMNDITVSPGGTSAVDTAILLPVSMWSRSGTVCFNTTAEGADVMNDVYDFPVLIRLSNSNYDFTAGLAGGKDLCFIKTDNTPLPYQVEEWDSAEGHAEVWVKVDTIRGNSSSQYISMLWGNMSAVFPENSGVVFDTARGFQGVWHMNETLGDAVNDATGNHYNGRCYSMGPASAVQGMIGTAQDFDGKTSYIVLTNTAGSKLNFPENGVYTVSAWIYAEMLDNDYHSIVSKSNQQYSLQINNDDMWEFFEFHNRVGWQSTEQPATAKTWKYLVGVRSGARQYLYVDGVLADSSITTTPAVTVNRITTDNVCFGRRTADTTRWFNGMIDEIRICSRSDGADWIKLCYMNQKRQDELVSYR